MSNESNQIQAFVAGHIALDIIPTFQEFECELDSLLVPGKLIEIGKATIATGGPVSNTGLILNRLGVPVGLMGKIGDDMMGKAILELMRTDNPILAEGMIVSAGENTSYSVVINPPGVDRIFLHYPGANNTFKANDIDYKRLEGVRLFHFGYPPLMRCMYINDGIELESLLSQAKKKGVITSLDMAKPDPASPAGKANWESILKRVLPNVDVFLPSIDEIVYMLDRDHFGQVQAFNIHNSQAMANYSLLDKIARQLLDYGVAIVVLKLGDQGLYLRTTPDIKRLAKLENVLGENLHCWTGRELLTSCFEVGVVGTTGSGDCTIAGFLAGLLKHQQPEDALTSAVAVGAFNVEQADAISGVPSWDKVQTRIRSDWRHRESVLSLPKWQNSSKSGLWAGPNDCAT